MEKGRLDSPASWWVITLRVRHQMADAISNFLFEAGATGIEEIEEEEEVVKYIAYFKPSGKESEFLSRLRSYLESLERLHGIGSGFSIQSANLPEKPWATQWKAFFKAFRITPSIVVGPPWVKPRISDSNLFIRINPAMAFGTGTHPTTRLCIKALEKVVTKGVSSVLDVGTGSGILAIVAAKLGAKEVWGIDTDRLAVDSARENIQLNNVSSVVRIRKGTIATIRRRFDVVVANIDFNTIKRLARPIISRISAHGALILSGLLEEQASSTVAAYSALGSFYRTRITTQEGWASVILWKGRRGDGTYLRPKRAA